MATNRFNFVEVLTEMWYNMTVSIIEFIDSYLQGIKMVSVTVPHAMGRACVDTSHYQSGKEWEMNNHKYRTIVIYRDVRSGQIVTEAYALRFPQYTTREVRRVPC